MVAALPFVVIGFVGLLMLLAFFPLFRPVASVIGQLPLVGRWLQDRADMVLLDALASVVNWAASSVNLINTAIVTPTFLVWRHQDQTTSAIQRTHQAVRRVVDQVIPREVQTAISYAAALYGQAVAWTNARFTQAVRYAQALFDQETRYAQALQAQALQYAQALHALETAYADQLAARDIQYAQAIGVQAVQFAEAVGGRQAAYARQLQAQALGFAEDAFGRAIDYERQLYGQAIDYAGHGIAQAEDYARTLADQSNAYTAAAVGVVAASVGVLERSPCIRYCDPLGALGSDLQELGALFDAGLLIALAAAAARDPVGLAREAVQELRPVANEAAGVFRDAVELAGRIGA